MSAAYGWHFRMKMTQWGIGLKHVLARLLSSFIHLIVDFYLIANNDLSVRDRAYQHKNMHKFFLVLIASYFW